MDKLSCEALSTYLTEQGLEAGVAKKLKDEKVDGKQFLQINADLLRSCGFVMGEICSILNILKQPFKVSLSCTTSHPSEGEENHLSDAEENHSGQKRGHSDLDSDNESISPEELQEFTDKLRPYFSEAELLERSPYDKQALCSQLSNYERACSAGFKPANRPAFVVRAEKQAKTSRVPLRTLQMNSNLNSSRNSEAAGQRTLQMNLNLNSSRNSEAAGQRTLQMNSNLNSSRNSEAAGQTDQSNEDSDVHSDHLCSDDNGHVSDRQPDVDYETPPFDLTLEKEMTPDQVRVSSLEPTLPNFNIFLICNNIFTKANDKLKEVIVKLKNSVTLTQLERKRLMRAFALFLYHEHSPTPKSVTPAMKEGFAKSFVIAFPSYMVFSQDGRKPWGLIFNRNGTGFLMNACRAPQRKHQTKRKKTAKNSNLAPRGGSAYDSDYEKDLALTMPDRANKTEILNAMGNTFTKRQHYRAQNVSITEMMLKYPHFSSYNGEVLREEFKRLLPDAKDGCKEFVRLLPQMLELTARRIISLQFDDDLFKGLMLISQHLPHDVVRRGKQASYATIEGIAAVVKVGDDIEAYIDQNANKGKGKPVQPYLILVKSLIGKKIVRTFLVLDRRYVQLTNSTSSALDALFKSFFVFNVQYPPGWCNTLHFLATCFYNVFESGRKRPDCIAPNEHELFIKLGGQF